MSAARKHALVAGDLAARRRFRDIRAIPVGGSRRCGGHPRGSRRPLGDIFRWNRLWERFARYFGMELAPPLPIPPGSIMADKGPVWDRIVAKHGLVPAPFGKFAAWGFGDFIFRCGWDVVSSTTKIPRAGFRDAVDSETMFLRLFDEFRARRVIP